MARARRSGDDRALAAAHTVLALVAAHDGDRLANDTHYLRALDHAERAGDVLQIIRIRLNRGSRLNEEGFHDEAIAELDLAIGLADLGGYGSFKAIALCNRGEARGALGRFDEALDDVQGSKAMFQRMGSLLVSYPLGQAGAPARRPRARPPSPTPRTPRRSTWRAGRATCRASSPPSPGWPGWWPPTTPSGRGRWPTRPWPRPAAGSAEAGALLAQAWVALAAGDAPGPRAIADRGRRHRPRPARPRRRGRGGRAAGAPSPAATDGAACRAGRGAGPVGGAGRARSARAGRLLALARLGGPGSRGPRAGGPNACSARSAPAGWPPRPPPGVGRARRRPPLAVQCLGGFAVLRGRRARRPSASGSPARPATW